MDQMTDLTRQRTSFNDWYDRNAEAYNAERKSRYHEDAELRQKSRAQARNYRKRVVEEGHVPALRNGLYTSARVARLLGVSAQTLRNWEAKSFIPKVANQGKHRLYTQHQVELLRTLIASAGTRAEFAAARLALFAEWEDA